MSARARIIALATKAAHPNTPEHEASGCVRAMLEGLQKDPEAAAALAAAIAAAPSIIGEGAPPTPPFGTVPDAKKRGRDDLLEKGLRVVEVGLDFAEAMRRTKGRA